MTKRDVEALARAEYPRRRVAQLHFIEGFMAELGDQAAARGLEGSYAEKAGAIAARRLKELNA